jgi:ribosomal protein L37AE/L43A
MTEQAAPTPQTDRAEHPDLINCPKCGAEQEDLDGFGVLYCEACGFCTHASVNGDICGLCGAEVKR